MTKSTGYFGLPREVKLAETLLNEVPEIKSTFYLAVVHNTNVAINLTNTQKTLATSGWKECPDPIIECKPVPEAIRGYLDYSATVLATMYTTGYCPVTGYTTALVSAVYYNQLLFTAGKYNGVKRMIFYKTKSYTYEYSVEFTDIYGVYQTVRGIVAPDRISRIVDLRKLKIDRSAALNVNITFYSSVASELSANGHFNASASIKLYVDESVKVGLDCYNSIDENGINQLPVVDDAVKTQILRYMNSYSSFLQAEPKVFSISMQDWIDKLAHVAAYAVAQGWTVPMDYNNLSEVKELSLSYLGALTNIGSGMFSEDPLIPEHFTQAIEAAFQGDANADILSIAALWAICDDMKLENSLV